MQNRLEWAYRFHTRVFPMASGQLLLSIRRHYSASLTLGCKTRRFNKGTVGAGSYLVSKHWAQKGQKCTFNLLAAFIAVSLADVSPLLSNQAVSYSMLQCIIMWLTTFIYIFYT